MAMRPRLLGLQMALAALRSRGYSTGKDKAAFTRTWCPCFYSDLALEAASIEQLNKVG